MERAWAPGPRNASLAGLPRHTHHYAISLPSLRYSHSMPRSTQDLDDLSRSRMFVKKVVERREVKLRTAFYNFRHRIVCSLSVLLTLNKRLAV